MSLIRENLGRLGEPKFRETVFKITLWFAATRLFLFIVGWFSTVFFTPYRTHSYTPYDFINIWGQWDYGWYQWIALGGYVQAQVFGFYPLYPLAIRAVHWIVGNALLSAVIVSNSCLLASSFILYRIVEEDYGVPHALRSVKYLMIFPTGFILSGGLSESMFMMLALLSYFFARRNRWFACGIMLFLLSLTKSYGVLFSIPLAYTYFRQRDFRMGKIDSRALSLLYGLFGWITFHLFTLYRRGDFFFYEKMKDLGWSNQMVNPIWHLGRGLFFGNPYERMNIFFLASFTVIMALTARRMGLEKLLYTLVLVLPPIFFLGTMQSFMRYLTAAFPIYISLALLTCGRRVEKSLTWTFLPVQVFFMAAWSLGTKMIV